MENTAYFKNKKVVIVGLARSGLACANLLYSIGASVRVTDSCDNAATRLNSRLLKSSKIKLELGKHTRDFVEGADIMVVSPGVTDQAKPLIWAKESGIKVVSEIEVAWILCPSTVIAVTGSSGKTTVTTLIGKVLEASGKKVFVCGNIGRPFSQEVPKMRKGDFVVLEVSSFQLDGIDRFKPKIALLLNVSCNHLDRHKDMRDYFRAKKRIFLNQDKRDYAILNYQDPRLRKIQGEIGSKVVYFKRSSQLNPNQAAVMAVGSLLGIDKRTCLRVFGEFKGIEHRLEFVAEAGNIRFINDSKATTAESAIWAINNITSPIALICGGRDKGIDYSVILPAAMKKIRSVIVIGEAKNKIKKALGKALPVQEAKSLEQAVGMAFKKSLPGDSVLLSPMCSSYDMFLDYEERGRIFKKIVGELVSKKSGGTRTPGHKDTCCHKVTRSQGHT